MPNEPSQTDILVPFEIENFPEEYRGYYEIKRNNMFAMIQKHREMWNYFHMLDQIPAPGDRRSAGVDQP